VNPVWFSGIVCESLIAVGRLDEAEQRIHTTLATTRKAGMPHWEGLALRARGRLHAVRGHDPEARQDFDAAISVFEELGSRIELGRTLVLRAPLGSNTSEDLDRARTLFDSCGAASDLAKLG
jgi:hypothetical protein